MPIWATGSPYDAYVGRWSRLVVREFLPWLAVPSGSRWLDTGCGTGALSEAVLREAGPAEVVGIDPSDGFIAYARERVRDERATFTVVDAQALPFAVAHFDAAVSGLVLNFIASRECALAEMVRVVRPGGTLAAYVWDSAGEMQLIRRFWDAAPALDPGARDWDEGRRFPPTDRSACSPVPGQCVSD